VGEVARGPSLLRGRGPLEPLDPQALGAPSAAQLAQLEGANQQLWTRLQEALGELQEAQGQLAILTRLQQQWEFDAPDAPALVEAALAQERLAQDARSERVLAVLQAKASAGQAVIPYRRGAALACAAARPVPCIVPAAPPPTPAPQCGHAGRGDCQL
jgi:hypothetical protein